MLKSHLAEARRAVSGVLTNRIPFKKTSLVFHHLLMRNKKAFRT
jgi:hypothetical protein